MIGCTLSPLFIGGAEITRRQYRQMLADRAEAVGVDHVGIGSDAVLGGNWLRLYDEVFAA